MILLKVDYEEFDAETYEGVVLQTPDGEEIHRISEDGFRDDYEEMVQWIRENRKGSQVMVGSSVNHFIIDKRSIKI